ncbi:MFS transporter, partial [Oscillospiraceae bacterium OttesenSCG-928-F05]|nr:MFS transporter [Oscillospiraceae bacterium OttesenSCG-928-F05]
MTVLLILIYIAFISLGLPDSLLGSAWPAMHAELGVPISGGGVVSMIIAGGTIVSSLLSDRILRKLGTGPVTFFSVLMTAAALHAMSFAPSFAFLCLAAVPLGLGAGSVDAALNNFVALHYKAAHMNWLHCFWGLGASAGPVIISAFIARGHSWAGGYRVISLLQFALTAVLIFSLPLWKKASATTADGSVSLPLSPLALLKLPRGKATLTAFFCYCAVEAAVGLWSSSYLVTVRGVSESTAAGWLSLFFAGITAGRVLSGFLSMKIPPRLMLHAGQGLIAAGIVIMVLPLWEWICAPGLLLIGLGCAPIFPGLLHNTPESFG